MVHQGHITQLRLGSSKVFIVVALLGTTIWGSGTVASVAGSVLHSSVVHSAPAAGATDATGLAFGGALAPRQVQPLYREREHSGKLVHVRCAGTASGIGCYELG